MPNNQVDSKIWFHLTNSHGCQRQVMGHLIPFLELSKCLARKGVRVSFISSPRNIERLAVISPDLSSLITFVKLKLPHVDKLPEFAEATIDLPVNKVHYLKKAFDCMEDPLCDFLENSGQVDWFIYDVAAYWLPPLAAKLGVPCAYFCLINAASMSFFGPPPPRNDTDSHQSLKDFLRPPKWIPFPSNVFYRLHEVLRMAKGIQDNVASVSEFYRFRSSVEGSDVVFIRSCKEFEPEWISLLEEEIYKKPVIPVGLLPPSLQDTKRDEKDKKWEKINEWLGQHEKDSVVYVAIGTEAEISQEEVTELALGLEQSDLPFFWVLRNPPETSLLLPEGFEDRVSTRGFICKGWAPQVKILAHQSVGGFLTHCGWNSIVESLSLGLVLVLLPFLADQGLNARVMEARKLGVEIARDERDGSFTRGSVAKSLRLVMVDAEGEVFRTNAGQMRQIFGNEQLNDGYIDNFVDYLRDYMICPCPHDS